ncbi:hypothetical protein Tco_0237528 [Tanacetum coccineum]
MLGNNYKNDKLKTFKPHQISATSFKKPSASEVPLTSHMLKVSKLSPVPEESLILSSRGVNNDDKDLSSSITQVDETQHAKETVAIADATQSIDASKLAEELGNQPKTTKAEKVTVNLNIRGTASNHSQTSLGESGEVKGYPDPLNLGIDESPFDIDSEIKFVRKVNPTLNLTNRGASSLLADKELTEDDSNLESMSDDEIESVFGFEADIDDVEDNHSVPLNERADVSSLSAKVENLESSLAQQNILPWIIKDSVTAKPTRLNKSRREHSKAEVQ